MNGKTTIALLVALWLGLSGPALAGLTRYEEMNQAVHHTSPAIFGRRKSVIFRASKVWETRRKSIGKGTARRGLTTVDDNKPPPPKARGKPTGRGHILIDRRPPHKIFYVSPPVGAKKAKAAGTGGQTAGTRSTGEGRGDFTSIMRANMRTLIKDSLNAPYCTDNLCNTPKRGFKPGAYVAYLYQQIGRVLPKTPEKLYRTAGIALQERRFEPGDLLFFRVRSHKTRKTGLFVGIWYGNNLFAYPSYSLKKVVRSDFRRAFWKQRFLGARRIIGTAP